MSVKIVALAGSSREGSFNKKLVQVAKLGAEEAGATVEYVDLRDFQIPIFDEDLEKAEGPTEDVKKLKEIFKASDGILIASPEYNSSVSALLKNAIDWLSRHAEGEGRLAAFSGKSAGIMSASPGALGGLRGLVHLRSILSNIGVTVIPEQRAIGQAHEAFGEDGLLKDQGQLDAIKAIGARVAKLAQALKSA